MVAIPTPEPSPIYRDEHGRLRIVNSSVLFDLVIYSFLNGDTPETIIDQYPSLLLSNVYAALAYYLGHRSEIDAYLREQEAEAEKGRHEDELRYPVRVTRDILLTRLDAKNKQQENISL